MLNELYSILIEENNPIEVVDSEDYLSSKGINYALPIRYREDPAGVRVNYVLELSVDSDEDPVDLLFPEEE